MFTFHLSLMAALAVFAAGMVLLYKGKREAEAGLLRFTGIVLIVGSIASALCSTYFAAKYHFQGGFDSPCPHQMRMHKGGKGMMGGGTMMDGMGKGGMMGGGMMGGGMMGKEGVPRMRGPRPCGQPGQPPCEQQQNAPDSPPNPEEHEEHH